MGFISILLGERRLQKEHTAEVRIFPCRRTMGPTCTAIGPIVDCEYHVMLRFYKSYHGTH